MVCYFYPTLWVSWWFVFYIGLAFPFDKMTGHCRYAHLTFERLSCVVSMDDGRNLANNFERRFSSRQFRICNRILGWHSTLFSWCKLVEKLYRDNIGRKDVQILSGFFSAVKLVNSNANVPADGIAMLFPPDEAKGIIFNGFFLLVFRSCSFCYSLMVDVDIVWENVRCSELHIIDWLWSSTKSFVLNYGQHVSLFSSA